LVPCGHDATGPIGVLDHLGVLAGMLEPLFAEPGYGAFDPLLERHLRFVAKKGARLGYIGDVVGHLTEKRGRNRILRSFLGGSLEVADNLPDVGAADDAGASARWA
jgi:hypothetical protein